MAALALPSVGSGVIYAVLVAMWAAYFIPRWLRRHEELSESRSVERFDRAMHILSRRDATPDKRYVVMPPRPDQLRSAPKGPTVPAQRASSGLRTTSSVTVRRRRVLAGLLLTLVVSTAATPLTALSWWTPLVAVGAVLGWLAHCRLQARSRSEVDRTRQAVRRRSRSRLMRFDALERLMTVRRELAEERAAEEVRWQEAEEAMRREADLEAARRRSAEEGWSPVPVPLPTYVTKPPAPRRTATIDLTKPGAWTAAQSQRPTDPAAEAPDPRPTVARPAAMSSLLDDAEDADVELDSIIDRRAVND